MRQKGRRGEQAVGLSGLDAEATINLAYVSRDPVVYFA